MKTIRPMVFETNSSSTHSISICSKWDPKRCDKLLVEDGICTIFEGEFGWGVETFHDAASKASYLATSAHGDEDRLEVLAEVIRKYTGASEVRFEGEGYIDHQSIGVAYEAFESDDSIRDFIFNPKSVLRTDNDNH